MAGKTTKNKRKSVKQPRRPFRSLGKWMGRFMALCFGIGLLWVTGYAIWNPPSTIYMEQERNRLGKLRQQWVPLQQISPVMLRSVVAAEDANFCNHWGFDMTAIRTAIDDGAVRGASSITQQTVKNAFLWHGRSWTRKLLETLMTPMVEVIWSKERILEVYLNIAEFDEGVFGVQAAGRHYFGVDSANLRAEQAALLAAILPSPKSRSPLSPAEFVRRRASSIRDGANTIRKDGRAACFQD